MARIVISGSSTGPGPMAGQLLAARGQGAALQDRLIARCAELSGVALPA